jgi:8-oxo-dGTP pyrophosphatase MutT (NUDIX family)
MTPWRATVTQKAVLFADERPSDGPAGSDERAVLVVRDASDGDWEFPGGRVDRGERPVESVDREVREETGLSPALDGPVFTATKGKGKRGKFFVYYRGRVEARGVTLSDEHDDYAWLAADAAAERLNKRRRRALSRALER